MPTSPSSPPLIFAKLGGSLITDKRHRSTPQLATLRRLAQELRTALETNPMTCAPPTVDETNSDTGSTATPPSTSPCSQTPFRLILGHGSGSFGHWEANRFGTRHGVHTAEEWHGFTRVSAAALQLNRLVTESFVEAGIPVLSLQPAASASAQNGALQHLELSPLRRALSHGLVPLVFGDVAFDQHIGGTILSTEDIFVHLAKILRPAWILLFGNAPGVLMNAEPESCRSQTIPQITPDTYPAVKKAIGASGYTDVTGGMADKVERMITLVQEMPDLRIRILSGNKPGNFRDALQDPEAFTDGTLISAAPSAPPPADLDSSEVYCRSERD